MSAAIELTNELPPGRYIVAVSVESDGPVYPGRYYLMPAAVPCAKAAGPLTLEMARRIAWVSLGPMGDVREDPSSYEGRCQVGYRLSPVQPPIKALILTRVCGEGPTWEAAFQKMHAKGFPVVGWEPADGWGF